MERGPGQGPAAESCPEEENQETQVHRLLMPKEAATNLAAEIAEGEHI